MLKDLFLLDPQVVFLNHGSFGACPRPVFEKYQAWQRDLELQPVQFLGFEVDKYLHFARKELADYLHTTPDTLVYIPNATHGINIVAHSLKLQAGDEVLATDQEYGACNFTWEFICNKCGAVYKQQTIKLPVTSDEEILNQLWSGVTDKTRVIFISHITSPTALTLPVEMICKRAHKEGMITIIDGAHAPGQMNIDLNAIQADFYIGNCHKWMLSPKGAGFIYANPEVQDLIEPLIVSWGYQSRVNQPKESIFIDSLQWTGTKDPAAALSVPAAIEFMRAFFWNDVRKSCHDILKYAMEQLNELTGIPPLYPIDSEYFQQMATVPINQVRDINELKTRLYNDYRIEIPCIEWNRRHFLRISVQGYNSIDDINHLTNAMTTLLPQLKS